MNCQKFEENVSNLARGQMMDAQLRTTALAHADDCSRCSQRLSDEQALSIGLKALATQMHSLGAPNAIEVRLRQAMREPGIPAMIPSAAVVRRRGLWVAVAAAVLLLVGSAIAISWQHGKTTGEQQYAAGPPKAPEPAKIKVDENKPQTTSNPPLDQVVESRPRPRPISNRIRSNKRGPAVDANHAREIATDFIPMGYMNGASFQEGGQIVRVELPRSALVRFGLPVNMERLNEKVKADVLLGVDGMAHAIRFVQ